MAALQRYFDTSDRNSLNLIPSFYKKERFLFRTLAREKRSFDSIRKTAKRIFRKQNLRLMLITQAVAENLNKQATKQKTKELQTPGNPKGRRGGACDAEPEEGCGHGLQPARSQERARQESPPHSTAPAAGPWSSPRGGG